MTQSALDLQSSYFGFVDTHDDAVMLIQACVRGSLQVIKRRPTSSERPSVAQSGQIFIYEEKSSGIQRWTDGLHQIAVTLFRQGKFEEAVILHRKVVNKRQQLFGADHPDALESANNLALVLEQQGKYEEAEGMHNQTLDLRKKALGEKHPSTLASMNNLAVVLSTTSMDNLAVVLRQQGKYEDAEQMQRQTLDLREKVLGEEHPSTLTSMNDLAEVLQQQGKYKEASLIISLL
ncbi:Gluconate transport-inducing protein required for gluconate-H+ symport [Exophiala xenobiotica]|nr:Gluconate transport-inducing protein required for gluconate-H+ symport [Exophiala xenobiotica]KAK5215641.1 Gluconate transport-inducing protein required for gluconate-H+ symport [Exophiala xenobiotica]KAK5220219.1 Gluconate transport-inducing protein required for gluconate-H+ symport [Exophiala xenobiotica]KAK5244435.1 Gluconate transport-inducing protein required for gluconate-H+ symport [Exophiala xenobiotica]KAK5263374.1 Gluconate transport-inducing protein required for gluconate-H+ sympo